MHKVSIWVKTW